MAVFLVLEESLHGNIFVINTDHLCLLSVFKNTEDLAMKLKSSLLPSVKGESSEKKEKKERAPAADTRPSPDHDPLRIPPRAPATAHPPNW